MALLSHLLVVYLQPADHSAGPTWSRPRDINRTILTSRTGFSRLGPGCLPYPEVHPGPLTLTIIMLPCYYSTWGCGHGGTR
jgi:hypothetical protein